MINLFHVSTVPNLTTLIPKRPRHFLTTHFLEEGKTKRVSFAPSIQKCLRAVASKPGMVYYVYVPTAIDKKYLHRVKISEVPDAQLTGEYWYLKPVNVRLYGVVKAGKLYNTRVFNVRGIGKVKSSFKPLFALSSDREYELLERYNQNGKKLSIRNALRNLEQR